MPQLQYPLYSLPKLDLLVAGAQVSAGSGAAPAAGSARWVCGSDPSVYSLPSPVLGPVCVLPPRKRLVALVEYK